ncbi:MAG TPA: nucleotidyltransferase domain-containing protein [Candidatus Hydrogenedentes bacterium]|nr:nucleotidyltransferase domain-containing protein [Candidatus Hydrogenedentota bacterium]HOV75908.1 nucleotidyltransferase domain-containing protein [Candidatus Hydrogenedentota bacterium]
MKSPIEVMDEAVARIVEEAHPRLVVVFGSAVRGDIHDENDLDLLVVMPDGTDRLETVYRLNQRLWDLGCPKDIIVVLESDVAALRDNPSMVVHTAIHEEKVMYRAA